MKPSEAINEARALLESDDPAKWNQADTLYQALTPAAKTPRGQAHLLHMRGILAM